MAADEAPVGAADPHDDPSTLSYEAAKAELRVIVQQLEAGSVPLEQTLELWQRGEALATRCRAILDSASAQIEAVASASQMRTMPDDAPDTTTPQRLA